jgi:hypothetical protein
MIANLAVLKSFGFILPMTKLFDGWRVAGYTAEPKKDQRKNSWRKVRLETLRR